MNEKELYKQLCISEPDIPLFLQYWWMEAASVGKTWDVFVYRSANGEIVAAMPFQIIKRLGMKFIVQPELTPHGGIWMHPSLLGKNRLHNEKTVFTYFIDRLDRLRPTAFLMSFHGNLTNWLPFYWRGFEQTTRYTYVIDDISNPQAVFDRFAPYKRGRFRKALKQGAGTRISTKVDPHQFAQLHRRLIESRRGRHYFTTQAVVESVVAAAVERSSGAVVEAVDADGRTLAAIFVVWNSNCGYLLLTADNASQNIDATTLATFEAIKFLSGRTRSFDFEGSMVCGIEHSYRNLGARQTPYFRITRSYNPILRMLNIRRLK